MAENTNWPKLAALSIAISAAMVSLPVIAQEAADQQEEDEEASAELGRVEVTGSRIKRAEFTSVAPVTTVTREDIENTGLLTLGDLLSELPQFATTFTLQNSARFIGTAGGGFLNLRGLGSDRTLVLVNGKRHVPGSIGDASVDINSIPAELIERIEVSTGAQSAVYGADAIAGTVNVILRDNFTGVTMRASSGVAEDASDEFWRSSASITAGSDFMSGKGNAVVSASWDKQPQLTAGERGDRFAQQFGFIPNPADGDTIQDGIEIDDGIPDNILVPNNGFFAFISEGGAFVNPLGIGQFRPDGSLEFINPADFEFVDGISCGGAGCDPLDLTTFTPLQVGFERFTADSLMTYEFNQNVEGYAHLRYANVDSAQQGQPSFDFGARVPVFIDNAFLRDDVRDQMANAGLGALSLGRFNTDLGLRKEFDNRQTFRGVLGVRGDFQFGGRTFDYDVFGNYGRTTVERVNENNRIDERWFAAVDAVELTENDLAAITNPDAFAGGVNAGDIVCRSTLLAAQGEDPVLANGQLAPNFAWQGCVPANILGNGNISDAAKAFINSTAVATGEAEQMQTGATLSSSNLADLWGAGPIAAAAGVEFRREQASQREDSLSALGNTFFNALPALDADFDVKEAFAEVSIPILSDVPFVQNLTLEGAGRISDYSTIGQTEAWEGRLNWQPVDQVRVRATIGEAVRAPTLNNLFSPFGENFANIGDPCDQDNLENGRNGRQIRIENCIAAGVPDPENFDSDDEESVPLRDGGNPNLQEETSDVWTIGFVWAPRFVNNLDFSVDLWDIEVSEAISTTGAGTIAARCVDNPSGINNQFCSLVDRGGDGNITEIRRSPLNLNQFSSRGVDIGASYSYNADTFGIFNFRSNFQYLDEREFTFRLQDNVDILEGELGNPDWQGNVNLNWTRGNWGGFAQLRVIDEVLLVQQETVFGSATNPDPNPDVQDPLKVEMEMFLDLGVSYSFGSGVSAEVSVDNVTNNLCPIALGTCSGGNSAFYDNVGRFYNFGLIWRL